MLVDTAIPISSTLRRSLLPGAAHAVSFPERGERFGASKEKCAEQILMLSIKTNRIESRRLNTLLINTGQGMPVSLEDIPRWLARATDSAITNGGAGFYPLLDLGELQLTRIHGGGMLNLRLPRQPVGLGLMAWAEGLEGFVWSEVQRIRDSMFSQAQGRGIAPRPLRKPAMPWLTVVLWPSFLLTADARRAFQAEQIFWAAAHGVLRQACGRLKTSSVNA